GGDAEHGSDGVSSFVSKTDGSIGYVEWSFAQANNLNVSKIGNGAGEFAELNGDSAGKTIASAQNAGTGNDWKPTIEYNTKAAAAYPIVLVTYEIVCEKGNSSTALPLIKGFLGYAASTAGQQAITKVGYAPLPDSVRTKVVSAVDGLS